MTLAGVLESKKLNILSLCDYTGNMVKPWANAGHYCVAVDIAHEYEYRLDAGVHKIRNDVFKMESSPPYFDWIFAFPPCTDLAVSGRAWFKAKGLTRLIEALQLVDACRQICETANYGWMIENPVSRLSSWRKPDHIFQPCDYGDPYNKKTCLWVGGDFKMPNKTPVAPTLGSKMHTLPPSPERARLRSETPMGFANAVFHRLSQQTGASDVTRMFGV